MAGQRRAQHCARTLDHVEHASRHARLVQDFRQDLGGVGGQLRRLEDHRVAGGQRREDLHAGLVHRPVPRRDQAADANRFLADQSDAAFFLELVGF